MDILTLTLLSLCVSARAFVSPERTCFVRRELSSLLAVPTNLEGIGYTTSVSKPLGVVFGENPTPFLGLRVDDVEPGLNGGTAGIREGDNLVAVNGKSVVGGDFDSVMGLLIEAEGVLELQFFRGEASVLYGQLESGGNAPEIEEEEEIVMDENYVSPVRVDVEEEKPLTAGDVLNAFKKVGSMLTDGGEEGKQQEKKKQKGLLGGLFSGETIQLEGDEASGKGSGTPRRYQIGKTADEMAEESSDTE